MYLYTTPLEHKPVKRKQNVKANKTGKAYTQKLF